MVIAPAITAAIGLLNPGGAHCDPDFPLAGRSNRQANLRHCGTGLYLPQDLAGLRVRKQAESKNYYEKADSSRRNGAGREPAFPQRKTPGGGKNLNAKEVAPGGYARKNIHTSDDLCGKYQGRGLARLSATDAEKQKRSEAETAKNAPHAYRYSDMDDREKNRFRSARVDGAAANDPG